MRMGRKHVSYSHSNYFNQCCNKDVADHHPRQEQLRLTCFSAQDSGLSKLWGCMYIILRKQARATLTQRNLIKLNLNTVDDLIHFFILPALQEKTDSIFCISENNFLSTCGTFYFLICGLQTEYQIAPDNKIKRRL